MKTQSNEWTFAKKIFDSQIEASADAFQLYQPTTISEVKHFNEDIIADSDEKFLKFEDLLGD